MTKTLTALAAVAAGMLALPAVGQAATTFGSRLNHDPANSGECASFPDPCTLVSFIHPSDPNGDPNSAGAPVNGVITKFRIRAFGEGGTAAKVTFRLASISRPDPMNNDTAVASLVAEGPTVTIPASNALETPILEFPARVTVSQGNHLALDGTNVWATVNNSGDKFTYVFTPPLVAGQGPRGSVDAKGELLVQAVIEPDADGDGFGDETQDSCPTDGTAQGACPAKDTTAPLLGSLGLFPRVFRVGGASSAAAKGTRVSYTLSEAADAVFTVSRKRPGRRVGGRCVKPRLSNLGRPRCTRYVRVRGSLTRKGKAGANSFRWNGRLRGRALARGRYRMNARATDAAGNRSSLRRGKFRIVKH